ncbi:cation:proton antiporter [Alicyclobacillus pomorum]|jgi:Kef-type K+ transport system membrane component KefB|uniref:cation:proton antiporter n=1 Tax=Alicyclobacillus pomorum TaxID=204470 RepID=UPI00041A5A82|nr:cation:proton antiporter [Alicyclobacillus pomorum]
MSATVDMFLIILSVSFVFTAIVSKLPLLRVPSAVAYLIFGIILHVSLVPLGKEEVRWITNIGSIGLFFLMFLSGLEVDISLLQPRSWRHRAVNPMYLAMFLFCGTLLLSYVSSVVIVHLMNENANPWMVTLLFATTSLGIILPILEESEVLHTELGQVLLLSALLADLFTMLLISLFISAQATGGLSNFLLTLIILPLGGATYLAFRWLRKWKCARLLAGDMQNRMRAIVALVALFCAVAECTGGEPILGSFLVGLLVSSIPFAFKQRLRDHCHGIGYGFLIPVFFTSVGLHFDVRVLATPSSWIWVPVCLLIAFIVKVIPAWHLRKHFGRRAALAGGLLMSSRLSLIVAAADIGVRIGALPVILSEAIVVVAVLTCLIAPIAFLATLG